MWITLYCILMYCIVLYCIVHVAYVVFTLCVVLSNDKFHVRLPHDRITDLRNDINMYVCMSVCLSECLISEISKGNKL